MQHFRHGDVELAFLDEGAGRADRAGARLCLQQGRQLGQSGLGHDADPRRPARDRARQSRARPIDQALRSRRLSHVRHGGGRARAARSSRPRARRRDGLFDGRAHHRVPGAGASRRACAARPSAGSASIWSRAPALPPSVADAMEAPSLADVQDPFGRTFRAFAEQTKSDRKALAACIRGSRQTLSARGGGDDPRAGADRGRQQGLRRGLGRTNWRR